MDTLDISWYVAALPFMIPIHYLDVGVMEA